MAGPQLLPGHALRTELRRNPFRPILLEDLRLLRDVVARERPDLQQIVESRSIRISETGYRTLYENTFAFTNTDGKTNLALLETSFRVLPDGSLKFPEKFLTHARILRKFLGHGLGMVLAEACESMDARGKERGFDPHLLSDLGRAFSLKGAIDRFFYEGGAFDFLSAREIRLMDDLVPAANPYAFIYDGGFPVHTEVPHSRGCCHTHHVIHTVPDLYFPSIMDFPKKRKT
ncbi:MAG: hypothetical protein AB1657_02035 [Candidatus Micrarchaeota archaeon]